MEDIFISGTIGYIHLENLENQILLLSDNHSSEQYCTVNSQCISDWLLTKNSKILLEEVPRIEGSQLLALWESKHIQQLKEIYLKQNLDEDQIKAIEAIDIRPLLIPFNLDIFTIDNIDKLKIDNMFKIKNIDKEYIEYINIIDYLKILDSFFKLEHKYFIKNIGTVYICIYTDNKEINKHFLKLKNSFIDLKEQYDNISVLKNIDVEFKEFKKKIDELLSEIMECYTIAKIFYNNKLGIHKFIIHAGLFHTTNLNKILIDSYGYQKINSDGEINFKEIKDDNNNCLKIPSYVNSQFGGYDKKYRKYKGKYLALKKLNILVKSE